MKADFKSEHVNDLGWNRDVPGSSPFFEASRSNISWV